MSNAPTAIEIFAGGGGMALGMRAAGFAHLALVEWWRPAANVLRHNAELRPELWAADDVIEADVRLVGAELAESGSDITLVAGGPPCQPFSLAGAGAGHSDDRNMFPAALEVVRRTRPEYVVFENVPGLLRPSFAPYLDYVCDQIRYPQIKPKKDELWNEHHSRIRASSSKPSYSVSRIEIDAADLGVAQNRRRVFIVGTRTDPASPRQEWVGVPLSHSRQALLHDQWVSGSYWDRHGLAQPDEVPARVQSLVRSLLRGERPTQLPWRTLRDLLADVPDPSSVESPEGWPNHIAIDGARAYRNHTGSPLDWPSKTIKAGVHGVAGGEAMLRDLDGTIRYLTVRESALVQGFPRDYEFPGPRSRVMGVIGNAVSVDVARAVGDSLLQLRKTV